MKDNTPPAMTGAEFREARKKLGLSLSEAAEVLQLGKPENEDRWRMAGRTVRRWESGENDIPGPVKVLMRWLAFGERPKVPRR